MIEAVRRHRVRKQQHGENPSVGRWLAQVGVLGWMIVTPTLIGVFLGRWIDRIAGTGIFWTGPLLVLGVILGGWSAWRWMQA